MIHLDHHRLLRGWLRVGALAAASLACGGALAQKIDDTPPAVQNNVAPNFMFLIDNSGSMNNIVPAAPYSSTATYFTGTCKVLIPDGATVTLKISKGVPYIHYNGKDYQHASVVGTSSGACFSTSLTSKYDSQLLADKGSGTGSSRSATPDTAWLSAEYTGHFLNWYFGNYTGAAAAGTLWYDRKPVSAGNVVETRIEIARRAATGAIGSLPLPATGSTKAAVRVGLSTYRTDSTGGNLLNGVADLTSTYRTTLNSSINALTAGGRTPLATSFADIARYMATGYSGKIYTNRLPNGGVAIDNLLYISGTDNSARNACLLNAPSCTSSSSPQPIQYWCQRSSLFTVTDGRPQSDRGFNGNSWIRDYDGDCSGQLASNCVSNANASSNSGWDRKLNRTYEDEGSDYMDDLALLMFEADWRPDLAKPTPLSGQAPAKNNIVTYMIGFADPYVQNDPLLRSTASQGGGRYIAAQDYPSLTGAFRSVMTDALAKDAAAAAVAVTNAQITAGTIGYASSYNSGSWYGDLEAYSLDLTTGLQTGAAIWHFRDQLDAQDWTTRKIVTWNGSNAGVPFTTANGANFRASAATLSDNVINYTRGDSSQEGVTLRARNYQLGDIINAEPVVVNYSSAQPTVYQPANDGMLHVIDGRIDSSVATAGQELWAYVPRLVHSKLAGRGDMNAFTHQYLVDGTPAVADVTGAGSVTKLLVGGLGKGGAGYYALDVSSSAAPTTEADAATRVLWEVQPANMGYSFGTPQIVKTADTSIASGWRVVVASGYGNDASSNGVGGDARGHVWVLNPLTGAVLKTFQTPSGFPSGTSSIGLAYLARPTGAASATVRYLYGGDLQGNVWRVDLNAASGADLVRVAAVTDPNGNAQPVTVQPVVAPVSGSSTKFWIYFGTGQYFSIDDVPATGSPDAYATQVESLYGVIDDTSVASPSLPNIRGSNGASCPSGGGSTDYVCQAASVNSATGNYKVTANAVDTAVKRGWYVDIPIASGRANTQPALTAGGSLVMVVNKPTNVACEPGGSSYFFELAAATGGAIQQVVGGSVYYDAGYAMASALSSRPVLVTTADGVRGIFRLSDKTTQSHKIDEATGGAPQFRRIYMRPLN